MVMLFIPHFLILPFLTMATSLLLLVSPPKTSPPSIAADFLYDDSILMDIRQVYQALSPSANQIVPSEKANVGKTLRNNEVLYDMKKESSSDKENQISLKMMQKIKRMVKENWEVIYDTSARVKGRRWGEKRMVARLGKRGVGQLRKLVFILSHSQRERPVVEVIQKAEVLRPVVMANLLVGVVTHQWEKKRQAKGVAVSKFSRVVRWLSRQLCEKNPWAHQPKKN